MPKVPDASSVTRLRAIQSSAVSDPVKKSASYIPSAPSLLYSLRASDAGRGMFPAQSYLANPIACGYVNPRHQGYITGPSVAPLPRIYIDFAGTDFDGDNNGYNFTTFPPGADFEIVFLDDGETNPPNNVDQITYISIYDTSETPAETFGSTTITTTPAWPGSTLTSSATEPRLAAEAGTFPGVSTVITFRSVPIIETLRIQFYGNTPP